MQLLAATRDVMVAADEKRVVVSSPERGELWSTRRSGGPVAARVGCDQLILSEPGQATVNALLSGEEQWRGETSGELVVAGDHLLIPGGARTSLVYSLRDLAATKVRTSTPLARPAPPGVRAFDGTLVAMVTGAGGIVLLDLADAVETDRATPVPQPVERAWLAGPFLIAAPPLSVSHLWGGVATPIPLAVATATAAVVSSPAQALVRAADRSAWLEFS